MKKIGILGGLSPESTIIYYRHIIRKYYEKFNDYNFPEIIIYSVNFQAYTEWAVEEKLVKVIQNMVESLNSLKKAGADFGIISANTPHIVFDEVQSKTDLPLLNIIDATAEEIKKKNLKKVGLLGTIFTMKREFYKNGMKKYNIETIVPNDNDQKYISKVIYDELSKGEILKKSKKGFLEIIDKLKSDGAEGIILGCTEIPLLINQDDTDILIFNTATIHAEKALNFALEDKN